MSTGGGQEVDQKPFGVISRFLIRLANGDLDVLATTPDNVTYFVCQGAAILATGALATMSSSYALSVAFGSASRWRYILFGIVWGLVIINLDRWLLSGTDVGFVGSGHVGRDIARWPMHFIRETLQVLPRFALAAVLGLLFAEPVLLRTFATEVTIQLKTNQQNALQTYLDAVHEDASTQQSQANSILAPYTTAVANIHTIYDPQITQTQSLATASAAGMDASQRQGCLTICKSIQQRADSLKLEEIQALNQAAGTYSGVRTQASKYVQKATLESLATLDDVQCREDLDSYLTIGKARPSINGAPPEPCTTIIPLQSGLLAQLDALRQVGQVHVVCDGPAASSGSSAASGKATKATAPTASIPLADAGETAGTEEQCKGAVGVVRRVFRNDTISQATSVLRLSLIAVDVLPVFIKWMASLFPMSEYYRRIRSRERAARTKSDLDFDSAERSYREEIQRRDRISSLAHELLTSRRERYLVKLSEIRARWGLRRLNDAADEPVGETPIDEHGFSEETPAGHSLGSETPPGGRDGTAGPDLGKPQAGNVIDDDSFLDE